MKKIKVLVVDDSAVVREVLGKTISGDPELHYLGSAADPIFAMQKMEKEWPDVLVLDIEMPRMDGITFLRKLSRESPLPVVICSSVAEKDASVTLEALSLGAAEIITKPRLGVKTFLTESEVLIRDAIKAAFMAGSPGKGKETASAGIPYTTDVVRSCAIVRQPALRMARRPAAPSSPMPVKRMPSEPGAFLATDLKRTSTDGRCRLTSSP